MASNATLCNGCVVAADVVSNMELKKCLAINQTCKACNKKNHFAKMCRSQSWRNQQRKNAHAVEQSEEENDVFISTVRKEHEKHMRVMESAQTQTEEEKLSERLKIKNNIVTFELDTGADCNAMSVKTCSAPSSLETSPCTLHCAVCLHKGHFCFCWFDLVNFLNNTKQKNAVKFALYHVNMYICLFISSLFNFIAYSLISDSLDVGGKLNVSKSKVVAFFGQKIAPLGKRALTCQYKGQKHKVEYEITHEDLPAVLGGATCVKLGLVKRMHEDGKENDILKGYEDLFTRLGCLPGQHHIQTDHTVTPVVHAPRRIPVALRDRINDELQRMEKLGVITRQTLDC